MSGGSDILAHGFHSYVAQLENVKNLDCHFQTAKN